MFNIESAQLNLDPFPHFFIDNFLTKEKYCNIKRTFPSKDWFADGKNGDGRTTSHTNRFNLSAGQYGETNFNDFINIKENICWKELYDNCNSVEFREKIFALFGKEFIKSENS